MRFLFILLLFSFTASAQQQVINVGTTPNDNTGDPLRTAMQKINANFTEAYDNLLVLGTASGTNAYTATPDPALTAYNSTKRLLVTFTNANTATTVTINVNSLGAAAIKDNAGNDPNIGDIKAGATYLLHHNGTNFRIIGASGTATIDGEVPSGTIDDVNDDFVLANTPLTGSVKVYQNGIRLKITTDYTISGTTITFVTAPTTGDTILCDYRR